MELHRTLTYKGHRIHFREEGKEHAQTLVLLHGFLQNLDVWSSYTLTYMRSIHIVAIDLPGHGYSDVYDNVHTMDFMAEAVRVILNEIGVEQCVMVGHSMGGYVALAFAEHYPYLLRGLGLVNSHAFADTPEQIQSRETDLQTVRSNTPAFVIGYISELFAPTRRVALNQDIKDLQDTCLETPQEGIVAAIQGMAMRPSRIHVLQQLEVPTLYILGKEDTKLPLEYGMVVAMEAKHAEVLILADVAHMALIEERDYVKLRLRNFVSTCYF